MKKRYPFFPKTWLFVSLLIAFAASFTLNVQAQTGPAKAWDITFGGSGYDGIRSLQQTSDGGYILGGTSDSGIGSDKTQASKGFEDYWVVKLDATGNKLWDKTFGGSGFNNLLSLQQSADGGYILGGSALSGSGISGDKSQPSKGDWDYWAVKLDASGNKTWDMTIGGSGQDKLTSLQQTSDGGYILGGSSLSGISGDKTQAANGYSDYWVVKLDASGNKTWDKTFGGSFDDALMSLQQTSDGGYILGGYSESGISGDKSQANRGLYNTADYWVLKLDGSGNKTWDKTFGGSALDELTSLQQTADGGYILGGFSLSDLTGDKSQASRGSNDYWVIKIDASGNKTWDKTFGGSNTDYLSSLKQTSDGGYILGGNSASGYNGDKSQQSKGDIDYWVVKLNASGNRVWDKTIGGSEGDFLSSLQQTSDNGYILGGYSFTGITGDKSQACRGNSDFWIVKLAGNVTGIKEAASNLALSIFPNPSQGKFQLQFSGLKSEKFELTVSDLAGKTLMRKEVKTRNGNISEEIDIKLAKGIYLLNIKADDQIIIRKAVVK